MPPHTSEAGEPLRNAPPTCTACLDAPAETLIPCGHRAWCAACLEACEKANAVLSLRCPLCRQTAIAFESSSQQQIQRRAIAAYLILQTECGGEEMAEVARAIAVACDRLAPSGTKNALRAISGIMAAGRIPSREERTDTRDDVRALMRAMCEVAEAPMCLEERAHAVFHIVAFNEGSMSDDCEKHVLSALDDIPILMLHTLNEAEVTLKMTPRVASRIERIALENDTELGALATMFAARSAHPTSAIFERAVDRADGSPAFASASVAFAACAAQEHASDAQLTRLAEKLFRAAPGDATCPESALYKKLCLFGAQPVVENGKIVALSHIRNVLIDPHITIEGVLPFCPFYAFFLQKGATPIFNRKGEVVGWRGVRIALELSIDSGGAT